MPLIVFAALLALAFGPAFVAGRLALIGDPVRQFYPIREVAWAMIRHGHLPLWSPYLFSGYPLTSEVMLAFAYPFTWGYLFLPGQWAEQIFVLAPYLFAPLFTYAFLREWRLSRTAAVLGGIAFTYGGFLFSPIGIIGVHSNSAMWMPLLLLAVARARRRPLFESLLLGTAAYTMSMLAGSGQIFLFAGALALVYAFFLAIYPSPRDSEAAPRRWQPFAVALGAIVLAAGLTAFQSFPTWATVAESVRQSYPQERVEEGSFTASLAWHSLVQPLGNYWDSSTFVPMLAVLLAITAICAVRRPQVWFWSFVALMSYLLILGRHSAIFRYYVLLPFVTKFRYPARHSLEWTFAIAVLAAYGWDFVESRLARGPAGQAPPRNRAFVIAGGALAAVAVGAFAIFEWVQLTVRTRLDQLPDPAGALIGLNAGYLGWKALFTLSAVAALVILWRLHESTLRRTLLIAIVAVACFAEPYIWMVRPAIVGWSVPRQTFGTFGAATRALLAQNPRGVRTYSAPHPYSEPLLPERDVDGVNWTVLAGLEEANGYESLILSRYMRAFRGEIDTEPFIGPDPILLSTESHLFDILNVAYVVAFRPFSPVRTEKVVKDGVEFTSADMGVDIKRERPFTLDCSGAPIDSVAVVTTLGVGGAVHDGAPVARITFHGSDGRVVTRDLIAGTHTSELGWDNPAAANTRPLHGRAPIFDSAPADPQHTWETHRYIAKIDLGTSLPVTRIDFQKIAADKFVGVGLWKASLHETASGRWQILPEPPPAKWETVYDRNDVIVIRNRRVFPRAWLVPRVEMLDWGEIVRRVRGESVAPFDPHQTALIENGDERAAVEARALNTIAAPLAPDDGVRIVRRDPTRIAFETATSRPAVLVVSEVDYPGWGARIDGRHAAIHGADSLLRAVFVPAGRHTIEMRYHPPGARKGIAVSLVTLLLIGAVALFDRRSQSHRAP